MLALVPALPGAGFFYSGQGAIMNIFDQLFKGRETMKTQTAIKPAAHRKAKPVLLMMDSMKPDSAFVFTTETTPEKRRQAADRLLRNMPKPVKKGEKSAHVLLAEYRAGK
ncbi:MAG: hypothetical protein Q7J21_08745 [Rugosibacter sp.]|nr:hypothetical protein [Rugosibacter sp.]